MIGSTRLDALRFSAIAGALVLLALIITACSTTIDRTTTGSIPRQVEMLALPGDGAKVPMPPSWMRRQIEQRMSQGKVPGFVEVSPGKLQQNCAAHEQLLGCVVNFQGLKVTYVRAGLTADVRHMVLVHEYAHDLYDWQH